MFTACNHDVDEVSKCVHTATPFKSPVYSLCAVTNYPTCLDKWLALACQVGRLVRFRARSKGGLSLATLYVICESETYSDVLVVNRKIFRYGMGKVKVVELYRYLTTYNIILWKETAGRVLCMTVVYRSYDCVAFYKIN